MASAIYPKARESFLNGDVDLINDDIKAFIIDTAEIGYTIITEFVSELTAAGIIATTGNLSSKTTLNGVFDAADAPISAVTGDPSETVIVFKDTGNTATSRVLSWNEVTFTADGSDVVIVWHASGIFGFV